MSTTFVEIADALMTAIYKALTGKLDYTVYKVIPKPPASSYVAIRMPVYAEQGDKDSFRYEGTVTIDVVNGAQESVIFKGALDVVGDMRGLLIAGKGVNGLTIQGMTVIKFAHEGMDQSVEFGDDGLVKITISDRYNFIIE